MKFIYMTVENDMIMENDMMDYVMFDMDVDVMMI